jgi:hypothetical protein
LLASVVMVVLTCGACSSSTAPSNGTHPDAGGAGGAGGADAGPQAPVGTTHVLADYSLAGGFYAAPFPDDTRLDASGHPKLDDFPNPGNVAFVDQMRALLERDANGFATTAGIYFALSGPLDASVAEDYAASLAKNARVFLVDIDEASPERGQRKPVAVHFVTDGGPYGVPNLLSLLPLQGIPLRPRTRYAAVVLQSVLDAKGDRLAVPPSLSELIAGKEPAGMSDAMFTEHKAALTALASLGIPADQLAGLAVFTTDDPKAGILAVRQAMLALPLPAVDAPWSPEEVFDQFCVYETTIDMPDYQSGTPPFSTSGGDWLFDGSGQPILQRESTSRIFVTVPRSTMPAAGYPIVLFSRTGAGGDRPLVDRGVQAATGGPAITPGTGPALEFAREGFAGASVDGPLGGIRNVTNGNEDFLIFNVANLGALRDNVRQSAAELALQAHILDRLSVDVSNCPGADTGGGPAHFDVSKLVLMGHSMGATIAPLSLAVEPAFHAGILSGEGGSWIENVMYKQKPLVVKPIAEGLLGMTGSYSLTEYDPVLSIFQWAAEPADPPVYAPYIVQHPLSGQPRDIYMVQGIVDHYIMPTISEASSLSLGLDFAGTALDVTTPEIASFPTLDSVLQFSGRHHITLPAQANENPTTTAVVVQQREDGVEDGHEVIFQTEPPKHQYRCFLRTLLTGAPRVPTPAAEDAPCN